MKRLIVKVVILVFPMFFIINIVGAAETATAPAVKSSVDESSKKPVPAAASPADPAAKDTTAVAAPAATKAKDAAPVAKSVDSKEKAATPVAAESSDAPAVSLEIEHVHEVSLDTIDIVGSGNWLEKRIWYEKAQEAFDEVLTSVHQAMDMRIQFSSEVNAIGSKIDSFYEAVDFDKGQLDEKFKEILAALEVEQKIKGDLSEKERNLKLTIKQESPAIDDLGKNIKSIGDLDAKMDQVLMQAFKIIDECRDLESKSWSAFTSISKEIDDKKARNLYYQINNYKQNIDQKNNYLKTSLLPYLHNVLIAKIESNIDKIKSSITDFKKKGVDLDEIMKSSQEDDLTELKKREDESNELAVEKALNLEHAKESQEKIAAAKKIEENYKKSWSYTLHNYYDIAKNNFIISAHAVGLTKVFSYVESYKYPIALYIHEECVKCKNYIYDFFKNIILYFNKKSHDANKPTDQNSKGEATLSEKHIDKHLELDETNTHLDHDSNTLVTELGVDNKHAKSLHDNIALSNH